MSIKKMGIDSFFNCFPPKKSALSGANRFASSHSRDKSTMEAHVDSVDNGRIKDRAFAKGLY